MFSPLILLMFIPEISLSCLLPIAASNASTTVSLSLIACATSAIVSNVSGADPINSACFLSI